MVFRLNRQSPSVRNLLVSGTHLQLLPYFAKLRLRGPQRTTEKSSGLWAAQAESKQAAEGTRCPAAFSMSHSERQAGACGSQRAAGHDPVLLFLLALRQ